MTTLIKSVEITDYQPKTKTFPVISSHAYKKNWCYFCQREWLIVDNVVTETHVIFQQPLYWLIYSSHLWILLFFRFDSNFNFNNLIKLILKVVFFFFWSNKMKFQNMICSCVLDIGVMDPLRSFCDPTVVVAIISINEDKLLT